MDSTRFADFVQSRNHSDAPFMFLQRRLPPSLGVEPDMHYGVTVYIDFLSKQPNGCFGIGGSPGDAIDINFDKSNQITCGLWLLAGTDSGQDGPTQLHYDSIPVSLRPAGKDPPTAPSL